jgi:hypothetical protein
MNQDNYESIQGLLKNAVAPVNPELQRDLWPHMLRRLEERPSAVPWFDWALLGLLILWLFIAPGTIPVLLYHL